ncbi:hypothetical protein BpHYR1_037883 [Brachionus plicatilis]|uniref:Uncharacterized protein n=1 Tax=Brachionus plicatilis TaxID=10195 RepID=A0A3M7RIG4_BRAPC|nr:hypothetical protein BpHYR1_037883 [Brachionus plicatilis]
MSLPILSIHGIKTLTLLLTTNSSVRLFLFFDHDLLPFFCCFFFIIANKNILSEQSFLNNLSPRSKFNSN